MTSRAHKTWLIAALLVLLGAGIATARAEHPPLFRVLHAKSELQNGVYYIDADMALSLKPKAAQALDNGVPLVLAVNIKLTRRRSYMWDETVAELTQSYRLTYHVLSRSYVVQNLNSGKQTTYRHWQTALKALGHLQHVPVIDATLLDPDDYYDMHLRAQLDVKIIPHGFGLVTQLFYSADQSSEWYIWTLR